MDVTVEALAEQCAKYNTTPSLKREVETVLSNNFHGWLPAIKPTKLFVGARQVYLGWEFLHGVNLEIKFEQNIDGDPVDIKFLVPHRIYPSYDHMNEETILSEFAMFLHRYKGFLKGKDK